MNVTNCKSCGRLFNAFGNERLCPECKRKLEDKFQEVKKYLEEHPDASVEGTAKDNDVSVKQIRQWIREERLILTTAMDSGIVCEQCGRPICTGRFCKKCKKEMADELKQAFAVQKSPAEKKVNHDGDRMRFL